MIDRGSMRSWLDAGGPDAFARAKMRTRQLLTAYKRPTAWADQEKELTTLVKALAKSAGIDFLLPWKIDLPAGYDDHHGQPFLYYLLCTFNEAVI